MHPMIEDQILIEAIEYCEAVVDEEQAGRSESWPSAAAVAYWHNAESLRRRLAGSPETCRQDD